MQIVRGKHTHSIGNDIRDRVSLESDAFRRIRIVQIAKGGMGKVEGFLRVSELHEKSRQKENNTSRSNERFHVRHHC